MTSHPTLGRRLAWLGALAAVAWAGAARADDDGVAARVPLLPTYRQECGACHTAYPPGMLPAASWQRLMSNLPNHFGTDASLDAQTLAEIGAWLDKLAGTYRKTQREAAAPPEDRITRSAWFQREHREVRPATWTSPAVKSASNCAACHTRADQGDYSERHVRIPR
ncbi:diheme cytochrome c [Azohydromonas sediminis]|uniref:diheme cytochrome c n=1 Tax=Azohydromonas sediminis TaxID=2259674 RepID=UPI000E65C04F|nr:diheme cytochrome c [Azohydromonas sediminis]